MDTEACSNVKIRVQHLCKSYEKLEVLRDVSLDVFEGEVVCIIGPSGGGKSTFLRCINRLEEYNSGTVYVDGGLSGRCRGVGGYS